jgi:hypothetical protein
MVTGYGPQIEFGRMGKCIKPGRGAAKPVMAPTAAARMGGNSIMACGPHQARGRPEVEITPSVAVCDNGAADPRVGSGSYPVYSGSSFSQEGIL